MKSKSFPALLLFVFVFILAACAPAAATPTPIADIPSPTPTAAPTAVPLSFVPTAYKDETNGFELDYPSDWTAIPSAQIGSRGAQAGLFSPGATAELLPDGASRLGITVYAWDPKNDLASYVTHRKTAWDAGGSAIVKESKGDLLDGRKEMDFIVQSPDHQQAFFLLTNVGEKYLEISGEGNLTLIEEITRTLRPLNFTP